MVVYYGESLCQQHRCGPSAFVPGRLLADLFSLLAQLLLLGGVVLPWVVCPFSGLYGPFLETVLSSSGPDELDLC